MSSWQPTMGERCPLPTRPPLRLSSSRTGPSQVLAGLLMQGWAAAAGGQTQLHLAVQWLSRVPMGTAPGSRAGRPATLHSSS